ncbi:MAG: hypothetical protein H6558_21210 [Lewinellaceae bacterium]|nr:hypothetical protein [Lewinellaceae bacterium]
MEAGYDQRAGLFAIQAKSLSECRQELLGQLDPGHEIREMLPMLERELGLFGIHLALYERSHVLGMSPLQPSFFELPAFLDEEQQKILAFFLPYGPQIRGDVVLTEACIRTAIRQPARAKLGPPKRLSVQSGRADSCVVDSNVVAGGISRSTAPCLEIAVGPVPPPQLGAFVPGGRQRRFLEEALLPNILPPDWEWETTITVEEPWQGFRISDEECPLRMDINGVVQ